MDWDVDSVTATGDRSLSVSFRDGIRGEVLFETSYFRGIFSPLADPGFFRRVYVDSAAVAWPGELDLAPDALHDSLVAAGAAARIVLS